ncbi:MAG: leucine-rich repeat domain-containing protein [Clostridia bacterium]|nr:leucine-rich repeat domain-containing protein [Clostridia bacterium]
MKTTTTASAFRRSLIWLGLFAALFCAVLLLCAAKADAASVVASGDCGKDGDNVKWVLDSDGVLTISGKGEMKDHGDPEAVPWYVNRGSIQKIVIKNGVTNIGGCAFYECRSLTSIKISDSVESIGNSAFSYCSSLTSIAIGNSVTNINSYAFWFCGNLKSVTIPDTVTSIGQSAFYECRSLTSIKIPNSVTSIGDMAFVGTALYENASNWSNGVLYIGQYLIKAKTSLSNVYTIKSDTGCIADYAFWGCRNLTNVTIPNKVKKISEGMFYGCSDLISIKIPNSVTSIGEYAFYDCNSLTSVTIPNSVTSIGGWAFSGCSGLMSVSIPNSVTSIGKSPFMGASFLNEIKVDADNPNYASDKNGCLYDKTKETLIQYPIGNDRTSFTIPDSVTSIGWGAFCGCRSLRSVTIPDSVITIGGWAFGYCDSLKKVKVMNSNCRIGEQAFNETPATIYGYKNSTAEAYAKESDLKFVTICNHVYADTVYTKKATTTANGMTYKKCTKCGAAKRITTIYKVSTLKLSKTSYVYTGAVRKPTPVVRDANGNNLKLNTDYKLKYSSGRKECGTYAVKVVFMGNYAGKKTLKFKIRLGKVTGITQQDSKGVYLTWNEVVGATRYEVWVYKEGYSKPKCMKSSTDTWIKNSNLTSGQVVKMEIRAVREVGGAVVGSSAVSYTAKAK